jgi:hypothetical protein
MEGDPINREAIVAAHRLIGSHISGRPSLMVDGTDFGLAAVPLVFKLELFQHAGSFKARGTFANLMMRNIPRAGVVVERRQHHCGEFRYTINGPVGLPVLGEAEVCEGTGHKNAQPTHPERNAQAADLHRPS